MLKACFERTIVLSRIEFKKETRASIFCCSLLKIYNYGNIYIYVQIELSNNCILNNDCSKLLYDRCNS